MRFLGPKFFCSYGVGAKRGEGRQNSVMKIQKGGRNRELGEFAINPIVCR